MTGEEEARALRSWRGGVVTGMAGSRSDQLLALPSSSKCRSCPLIRGKRGEYTGVAVGHNLPYLKLCCFAFPPMVCRRRGTKRAPPELPLTRIAGIGNVFPPLALVCRIGPEVRIVHQGEDSGKGRGKSWGTSTGAEDASA